MFFVGFLEFLCGRAIGTVGGNHLSARGEKRFRHAPADSSRTPGHNNSLIFEIEIHVRWIGKKKERDNNSTCRTEYTQAKIMR